MILRRNLYERTHKYSKCTYLLFHTINSRRILLLYMFPKSPLISRIKRNKKETETNKKYIRSKISIPTNKSYFMLSSPVYLMFLNERLVFIFLSISETLGIIISLQLSSIINDFFLFLCWMGGYCLQGR